MTGTKCLWGRLSAVSATHMNGARLSVRTVAKKNCTGDNGSLFRIFEECLDLVLYALALC